MLHKPCNCFLKHPYATRLFYVYSTGADCPDGMNPCTLSIKWEQGFLAQGIKAAEPPARANSKEIIYGVQMKHPFVLGQRTACLASVVRAVHWRQKVSRIVCICMRGDMCPGGGGGGEGACVGPCLATHMRDHIINRH